MKLAQLTNTVINLEPPTGSGFENLTSISFSDLVSAGIQAILVIASIIASNARFDAALVISVELAI